jgi:SAM-dependent methyltransferase
MTFQYMDFMDEEKWKGLADEASLRRMCELVEARPDDVVCDAGTGMGNVARVLAPKVAEVVAIDVEAGREAVIGKLRLPNVRFVSADLDDGRIPGEDSAYSVLVCRAALHHIGNKAGFFAECGRVLRPGGRLYIMDPVMSPDLRLAWSIISRIAEKDYRAYCTPEELYGGLAQAGFDIAYRGEFLFPRRLDDWIKSKINKVDADGREVPDEFVAHVRKTIWDVVHDLFPANLRTELHFDDTTPEGWFAYNCVEVVAIKSERA